MDELLERLTAWGISDDGKPGSVATRYSCEIEVSDHPEAAELRLAVHRAFIDGMTFANSIADAANRLVQA